MVFFTCNACNESLKKNQVEKHYMQQCRRCEFLSCVDCGKDFWGDSYQTHTKCISEEQKYNGKNFVVKANKGEVKQEQWIQKVQSAVQKAHNNPQVRNLLQRLEDYPNVPRKKVKFENFLRSSLRIHNAGLMNQVWDLLMAEAQQQANSTASSTGNETQKNGDEASSQSSQKNAFTEENGNTNSSQDDSEKKMSKRERKEERQKKSHKSEKKDKHDENMNITSDETGEQMKKKGKRKRSEEDDEEGEVKTNGGTEVIQNGISGKKGKRKREEEDNIKENGHEYIGKPKKKKKETCEEEEDGSTQDSGVDTLDDSLAVEVKVGKFNWGRIIVAVLKAKGEISVKKLRKKVLAEYASYGVGKGEERVLAKFNSKLSKLPNVKVLKDRAKLLHS